MRWSIVTIGKPRLTYVRSALDEYLPRLRGAATLRIEHLRASQPAQESEQLLAASAGMHRILLDETGEQYTSREFAARLEYWERLQKKEVCFLIGGSDGHQDGMRAAADECMALGRLTLQHELALVVLVEQIYRAWSIRQRSPYHRD